MKIAQEIRTGNVIMMGKDPMVVLRAEYNKSGRNAAVVKMKLKNLLNNSGTETVFKADEKMEVLVLEKKEVTYSYFADPMYVFMDTEYNQFEVEADSIVRGDTSGKVMKPARVKPTGFEVQVPAFVEIGDKIEIDTRTGEYRNRVK